MRRTVCLAGQGKGRDKARHYSCSQASEQPQWVPPLHTSVLPQDPGDAPDLAECGISSAPCNASLAPAPGSSTLSPSLAALQSQKDLAFRDRCSQTAICPGAGGRVLACLLGHSSKLKAEPWAQVLPRSPSQKVALSPSSVMHRSTLVWMNPSPI